MDNTYVIQFLFYFKLTATTISSSSIAASLDAVYVFITQRAYPIKLIWKGGNSPVTSRPFGGV